MLRRITMKRIFLLCPALICLCSISAAQSFVMTGTVRDAATKESLVAANVRIVGTSRGTITNADGIFRLILPAGDYSLIISYIGYKPDSVRVRLDRDRMFETFLQPIAIQYPEIVVTDEDPAYRIMRKVIENKGRWRDLLKSYEFDAFTRQVIRRDTSIAAITESYTSGYWQEGDTLREVVRQKRQTENVPMSENLASVGGIINFYDDEIRFSGFRFVGPTSKEAFEYYSFKLEQTRERDGVELYTIRMTPKSKITPLFRGIISVVGDSYSVVGIEVKPNESFRLPLIRDLDIAYKQQFGLYDRTFWLPVDIQLKGSAGISLAGFSFPGIGFEQVSSIYEYRINVEVSDTIFHKPRRTEAPEAVNLDSTFWREKEILPLSAEETDAYNSLDSLESLEKQFQPAGPLGVMASLEAGFLDHIDLRFNRVEGAFVGGRLEADSVTSWLRGMVKAGYGFSDKRGKYGVEVEVFMNENRSYSAGVSGYVNIDHFPDEGFFETTAVTLSSLFGKVDQRDYYYARGWRVFASATPFPRFSGRISYRMERQENARLNTTFSLLYRSRQYRRQPQIVEGTMNSFLFEARYGDAPVPLGLVSRNFAGLEIEHSQTKISGGDFSFSRFSFIGEFFIPTFLTRMFLPPTLAGHVSAGVSRGSLPPQRIFTLETRSVGFGPFGVLRGAALKQFVGTDYFLVSLEHNFRSIPFLALDIPFLYESDIELMMHASLARSWIRGPVPYGEATNGLYSEGGFGVSRIFGLLRIDVTRRFVQPSAWFVTIGLARIL